VEWLRAMGVEAVVVNGRDSKEIYHDFHFPDKFAGRLPVLFDNHQGDIVFGVPRQAQGIGRVVKRSRVDAIPPFGRYTDLDSLRRYANTVDDGDAAAVTWMSADEFLVHAAVDPGETVLIRESWDPAWHATSAGREVPLRRDPMGFMLADPPSGEHRILFRFTLPFENAAGRVITAGALAVLAMLTYREYAQSR
jgi:hypothetical protein